ncbi:MAG: type IV pilus assembly protein PilM [Candidatus Pacebacteria bacterium]|nr:type IV pilus assembly protein PilM [Candidatus Paceibacterota bacterium]
MLEFLNLKPESFGLDISDISLKIVKLKKEGQFFDLASYIEVPLKPGIVKKGEIRKIDELAETIKKSTKEVKGEGLATKNVVVSLPEEKAFLQVIQMPRLPEEDLKSAIIFEAENYIPLGIEEVYLDYQIISPVVNHLDHLDVLIAAFPRKVIEDYVSCLKKAGLKPTVFEIESLAIARALIKNEGTTRPLLLIDFGATRTGFIIFSGHSLRFTFSIPVSSQNFTEIISRTLKISLPEAEKLKIKYGLENKEMKAGKEVFDALIPSLTDLTEQIKKYLGYYLEHSSHEHLPPDGKGIEKILICGGGAKLKGLTEFLSSQLNLPVEIGNPWINILPSNVQPEKEILIYEKEESLEYTTVLGLALRGIKNDDKPFTASK